MSLVYQVNEFMTFHDKCHAMGNGRAHIYSEEASEVDLQCKSTQGHPQQAAPMQMQAEKEGSKEAKAPANGAGGWDLGFLASNAQQSAKVGHQALRGGASCFRLMPAMWLEH